MDNIAMKSREQSLFFSDNVILKYAIVVFCALLTACGGDEPEPQPKPDPDPTITASVQSITLFPAGGEQTFTVTVSNAGEWDVASSQSWLTVSKQGSNQVKVQCDANLSGSRTANVNCTVKGTGIAVSIPVTQTSVTITASTQSIVLSPVGEEQTFTVTCDADNWSATSSQSWLTVSQQGNTVKVQADASLENSRSAAVELKIGATVMLSVPVSQAKVTEIQSETLAVADLFGTENNKPLEEYEGVEVANGHVTAIELPNGNLSGSIPASIGRLTYLKHIDLSGNKLTGSIPAEIANLTKLEYLDLSGNNLSGSIPAFNTSKLVVLDLSENDFTTLATLPQNLPELEYLAFHQNKLQGSLPSEWSGYARLIYIDVSANAYTGSIPGSWSALTRMRALHLYDNKLSGELPAYLTTFSYLESLALHKNDFTGTIPADLGTLPDLESLWLSQNKFTGEIPASLLQNPRWDDWKENVGTQQSGYGFSNYSATKATRTLTTEPSDFGKQLKKAIRKRLDTGKRTLICWN